MVRRVKNIFNFLSPTTRTFSQFLYFGVVFSWVRSIIMTQTEGEIHHTCDEMRKFTFGLWSDEVCGATNYFNNTYQCFSFFFFQTFKFIYFMPFHITTQIVKRLFGSKNQTISAFTWIVEWCLIKIYIKNYNNNKNLNSLFAVCYPKWLVLYAVCAIEWKITYIHIMYFIGIKCEWNLCAEWLNADC